MRIRLPRHLSEKRFTHAHTNVRLKSAQGFGKNEHLLHLDIFVGGQWVGHCMRGHRNIMGKWRGKGYFEQALSHLEETERHIFKTGGFEAYKKTILEELESNAPYNVPQRAACSKAVKDAVSAVRRETFIDYTTLTGVVAAMRKLGYRLHPVNEGFLRENGFRGRATQQNMAKFAVENEAALADRAVYLLVKPVGKAGKES